MALSLLCAPDVHALDLHWTGNGTNDSWNNPANWNPAQVPTNVDHVLIDAPGTYSVEVDAPAQAAFIRVGSGSNAPTLRLLSDEVWVFGDVVICTNATMWLDGGDFRLQGQPPPFNTLTNHGFLQWDHGVIRGGPTYNVPGARMTVGGAGPKMMTSDAYNTGTIECESSTVVQLEGRMHNRASCILYTSFNLNGTGYFINTGSMIAPEGVGTVTFSPGCWFTNAGGAFVAETNTTLQFTPGAYTRPPTFQTETAYLGPGLNRIHNPEWIPLHWDGSTLIGDTLEINGGYVESGHAIFQGSSQLRLINVTFGRITVQSPLQVDMVSGRLEDALVEAGAVLSIVADGGSLGFGFCTNNGTLRWQRNGGIADVGGGWVNNNLFIVETNCSLSFDFTVNNTATGNLVLSGGDSDFTRLTNSGVITVEQGSLTVNETFVSTPNATTHFVLGGNQAGTGYGQLSCASLTAAGALEVTLTNGFVPSQGDSFELITYGSVSGLFSPETLPAIPGPIQLHTRYGSEALTLVAPEPLTLTLPTVLSNGWVELNLTGSSGQSNVLHASTNFIDWTPIFTNSLPGGAATFIDTNAALFPYRFYQSR